MEWKIHVHHTKVQSKNLQKVGLHSIIDKGIQVLSSFVKKKIRIIRLKLVFITIPESKDNSVSEVDLNFELWHDNNLTQIIIVQLLLFVSFLETMETEEEDAWTTVHRGKRR